MSEAKKSHTKQHLLALGLSLLQNKSYIGIEKPPITLQSFDVTFAVTLKVCKSGPNTFFLDMNDSWTEVEAHRYFEQPFELFD